MPPQRNGSAVVSELVGEGTPLLSTSSVVSEQNNSSAAPPQRLNVMAILAYGVGHVLNDVCASMWFSYTLLYMHAVVGMPGTHAGAILMLGQVVDALATPLVGLIADRPLTVPILAKFGRRKFCHLVGTLLVIGTFPFIFMPCWVCDVPLMPAHPGHTENETFGPLPSEEAAAEAALEAAAEAAWWQQILWYSPLVAVFQLGWAAVQIAHLSLIPDLTSSEHGRTELTAVRYSMSVCSSVVVYMLTWSVLHITRTNPLDQIGPGDAYKFRNIVLIGTAIGSIFSLLFYLGLKEPTNLQARQIEKQNKEEDQHALITNRKIHKTTASFFRDPRLYQAALLYVSSRLFSTLSQVFVPLYLDESLGEDAESLALVPLATFLASFAASLGVKWMNRRCGRMLTYMLGALLCLVGCMWIYLGSGPNYESREIYVVAILLGSGSSVTLVTSLCITADLIGDSTDSGAAVYSAVTFADKLFNGLAVMLIESLKCADRRACPHYYRDVLSVVCGGTVIFGLAVLFTYWRPRSWRLFGNTNRIP